MQEIESRHILSKGSYGTLYEDLQQTAGRWRLLRQHNFCLSDEKKMLIGANVMPRVRVEQDVECSSTERLGPDYRITFDVKGPPQKAGGMHTVRDEKGFDIRNDIAYLMRYEGEEVRIQPDFKSLPHEYRLFAWEQYQKSVGQRPRNEEQTDLVPLSEYANYRLRAEMGNDLILELDMPLFLSDGGLWRPEYELEVERMGLSPEFIGRFVHEKFKSLDIPVVFDASYPSKAVRALAYAGHLDSSLLGPVEKCRELAEQKHSQACEMCKEK